MSRIPGLLRLLVLLAVLGVGLSAVGLLLDGLTGQEVVFAWSAAGAITVVVGVAALDVRRARRLPVWVAAVAGVVAWTLGLELVVDRLDPADLVSAAGVVGVVALGLPLVWWSDRPVVPVAAGF